MPTIEFPETARLVFRMPMGSRLIVNPRACKGASDGVDLRVWPNCPHKPHECKEQTHGPDSSVPVSRFVDNQYGSADYGSPWFAFWEADCMDPPIWIVRAASFESAYEDFLDTLPEIKLEDLDEDQRAMVNDKEGNLPDGYTFAANGLVFSENVNGCEIALIEVTCE